MPSAYLGPKAFTEHANGLDNFAEEKHLHQSPHSLWQIAVYVACCIDELLWSNVVAMSAAQHVVCIVDYVPRLHGAGHCGEDLHHPVQSVGQEEEQPKDEADYGNSANLGKPKTLLGGIQH